MRACRSEGRIKSVCKSLSSLSLSLSLSGWIERKKGREGGREGERESMRVRALEHTLHARADVCRRILI
jgi:hypothetical protein